MNALFTRWLLVIILLAGFCTTAAPLARAHTSADVTIYADALASGWEDWSWQATTNASSTTQVHSGVHAYAVTYTAAWAGFSLRVATPIDAASFTAIRFWAHGGAANRTVNLYVQGSDDGELSSAKSLTLLAGGWSQYTVPLSDLGDPAVIRRINLQDATGAPQGVFHLDDIQLIGATQGGNPFPDATPDRTLNFPGALAGVAIAPNGRLYVAAWRENKIYSWRNAATAADPTSSADLIFGDILGQRPLDPNSGCGASATSASLLCGPESVAVDAANNLYVGDTYNHRVLIFLNPDVDADPTEADIVLGQGGSFTSHVQHLDAPAGNQIIEGFSFARGLALTSSGDLWVIDQFGHRAVKFNQPLTGDDIPDLVVGQPDLATLAAGSLRYPLGVAVDAHDNVYVADVQSNQVVRFDSPAASQGAPAQAYTDYAGANPFEGPTDVAIDAHGNLYAAYNAMRRIGVFASPLTDTTGDYVLEDVNYPHGMDFDAAGNLYVALCNGVYPCDNPGKLLIYNAPASQPPNPEVDVTLTVNAAANRRPISDDIYGVNWGSEAFAAALNIPMRRWGGNRTTRYNWQNDMSNTAIDWYFENVRESNAQNPPDDSAVNRFVAQDRRTGAASYLTVPLIGWVSNNDASACSFSTAKYAYTPAPHPDGLPAADPGRPQCGNGVIEFKNGNSWQPVFYAGNDKLDASIAVDASFAGAWVSHLTNKFGTALNGGVRFYGMDNEPDLWNTTHADVHPQGVTYDELVEKTIAYAAAIKSVDPGAQVLGPEFGGWWAYFTSARDVATGNDADRQAHGNQEITAWYLQQLAAYEQQHGARLLDYLSLHFYPQAAHVFLAPQQVDAATQQRRLRSIRALWDPTYADESWIADTEDGPYVRLIPRMRAWIDANYPGVKLAVSEYNWGALNHINGALAQADILGIFGREGVDLASLWDPPTLDQPGAYAFRIYRNYDGQGGRFGDVRVAAASSDQGRVSVYASQRSSDGAVTIVAINKSGGVQRTQIRIDNFNGAASAQVYQYSPSNLNAIVRGADQPLAGAAFSATLPTDSLTLFVVPADNSTPVEEMTNHLFLPAISR